MSKYYVIKRTTKYSKAIEWFGPVKCSDEMKEYKKHGDIGDVIATEELKVFATLNDAEKHIKELKTLDEKRKINIERDFGIIQKFIQIPKNIGKSLNISMLAAVLFLVFFVATIAVIDPIVFSEMVKSLFRI